MMWIAGVVVIGTVFAQAGWPEAAFSAPDAPPAGAAGEAGTRPKFGSIVRVDVEALNAVLDGAPAERRGAALGEYGCRIDLPHPRGRVLRCFAAASPVMEAALAARFPQIRTFIVQSEDGGATGRLEVSARGLTAMLRTVEGTWMIDAAPHLPPPGVAGHVVAYWLHDAANRGGGANDWTCHCVEGVHGFGAPPDDDQRGVDHLRGPAPPPVQTFRTVRLAVACSGEYGLHQCQLHGHAPNGADALAAIVTTVSRANVVFEADLGVHFNLVAGNDRIVFFDPATDPYPDTCDGTGGTDCSGPYLAANADTLATIIGEENFDVGHVLTRVYGGVAQLSSVCRVSKARGVSGIPRGGDDDAMAFLVFIHELGHQFGATHTFSGTRGRCAGNVTLSTAWEAGSGSSPMAYAGGCPVGSAPPSDNVVVFADPYFHHGSIRQMSTFLTNTACPVQSDSSNHAPVIASVTGDSAIPPGTPFVLSAAATDEDGDVLTYSWEQFDAGAARPLSDGGGAGVQDNGVGALFRIFPPVVSGERTFPRMADVLAGVATPGERLPTVTGVARRFRVVVRDNHPGVGATAISAFAHLTIAEGTSPFTVVSPAAGAALSGGANTVTWTVGGTDAPPISCASVTMRFSMDNGLTFPMVLGTFPNTGSAAVTLPGNVESARVRIDADEKVFFAVSGPFAVAECDICLADINCSGAVTVQDIFDFLGAYFAGETRGDFDESGTLGVQDIFDFLAAYFAGC